MKKGKLLVLALIALMSTGGLALASCEISKQCDGGCKKKQSDCSNPQGYSCGMGSTTCNCN